MEKYIKTLAELLEESNFEEQSRRLYDSMQSPLTPEQQQEYEALDNLRISAAVTAGKKCRNLKMGGVEWCPQLQKS